MNLRSLFPSVRLLLAVASVAVGLLGLTAQAQASSSQQSMFQDDRLLQNSDPGVQARALDDLKAAGVKSIHTLVLWKNLAPSSTKASVPSGFDATNPATGYDQDYFAAIDRLVEDASQRGIQVLLSPTGPAPDWALDCLSYEKRKYGREKGTCRPNPKLYGQFVTALAKRYSGNFTVDGTRIPKVKQWSIWNEPNLNSWISPQILKFRNKKVSVGAMIYRNLVYAGTKALRGNGHRSDKILLGETAPIGLGSIRTAPVVFYQTLFCVGSNGRKLKGTAARNAGCLKAKRLDVNGVSHHPYTKGGAQNPLAKQHSTDITVANLGTLSKVLAQGVRAHMLKSSATGIYLTEFGVSSRPPAKSGYGVKPSLQAEWINLFEFIAFRNSKVKSVSQYQLDDSLGPNATKTFQTGLRSTSGKPKAAFAAYRVPLYVQNRGSKLTIWGGVRGKSGKVDIYNGKKKFKTVRLRHGYFITTVRKRSGRWQLRYKDSATHSTLRSRSAVARTLPRGY